MRPLGLMTVARSLSVEDRLAGVLQAVDADDQHLVLLPGRLDDAPRRQGHVVRVEEPALDVREALEQVLPERRHLIDFPVARCLVDDLDIRVIRQRLVETLGPALRSGMGELRPGCESPALPRPSP